MRLMVLATAVALASTPVAAQEMQAGNDASRNADATFQELIDRCNESDIMVRRAKIRVQLAMVADDVRPQVEGKIDEAFATCGEGNIEAAVATMEDAAQMAAASVESTAQEIAGGDEDAAEATAASAEAGEESKPWWQFW